MKETAILEFRVIRLEATGSKLRYRWDVVVQRPVQGRHSGVFDAREHIDRYSGYTRTSWGAWRAVHRVHDTLAQRFDIRNT